MPRRKRHSDGAEESLLFALPEPVFAEERLPFDGEPPPDLPTKEQVEETERLLADGKRGPYFNNGVRDINELFQQAGSEQRRSLRGQPSPGRPRTRIIPPNTD